MRVSRGLLTTGLVGGWLTGSAYLVAVLVFGLAAIAGAFGRPDGAFDLAVGAGFLALLAMFVWVGGMVCVVVGWFGLGGLHRVARLVGWLGILVLTCAVILPLFGSSLRASGTRAVGTFGMAVYLLFYVAQALYWLRRGTARGLAMLAVVGSALVVVATLVFMVLAWTDVTDLVELMVIALFAAPTGGVLAHFGGGLAMGREREIVRALQSFD